MDESRSDLNDADLKLCSSCCRAGSSFIAENEHSLLCFLEVGVDILPCQILGSYSSQNLEGLHCCYKTAGNNEWEQYWCVLAEVLGHHYSAEHVKLLMISFYMPSLFLQVLAC